MKIICIIEPPAEFLCEKLADYGLSPHPETPKMITTTLDYRTDAAFRGHATWS
jgi:hypothetical protein